jgi:hypothetical protein
MPVTPVLGFAAEVTSTYPAQVASTHGAAEVASTAAITCKRIVRNTSAPRHYGGNRDRDSVQHKFLHGSFLSG